MPELSRRGFLSAVTICALVGPVRLLHAVETPAGVDCGLATDFADDGAWDTHAADKRFFLVRKDGKLVAVHSICSHEQVPLTLVDKKEFYCPEHRATFNIDGTVRKGKPRRALNHFGISINKQGHVIVDTSKKFPQSRWADAGASVEVK